MFVFVVPAILAGVLGVLGHNANDAKEYLAMTRVAMLGSVALGMLGVAIFTYRKLSGIKRWAALLWLLLVVRVSYLPILTIGLVVTGWLEWATRAAGGENLSLPVHYMLPCFWAMTTTIWTLVSMFAISKPKQVGCIFLVLITVGLGVLSFWMEKDRHPSPHLFHSKAPGPATTGPSYLDVAESSEYTPVARVFSTGGVVRHALQSRKGWSGVIRDELIARYRGAPNMSILDRVSCLEAALVKARPSLAPPKKTSDPE